MKNKILEITFVLLAVCAIAGCGKDAQKSESNIEKRDGATVDGNSSGTGQSADDMLHFVDAHGQWYDVKIDHLVSKNEIEWKYLENDGQILNYEGNPSYTIKKGVDVSKYQGDIDWKLVKEDGYEFAIIRIGFRGYGESGKIVEDERFREYIKEAHAAGLDVGVYFFSQAVNEQEAVEEADFVLDMLDGQSLELPITYDPELIKDDEARTDNVSGEQFTANTIAFCERIRQAGYQPMVYSNMYWEAFLFDMTKIEDYPIWYADYELIPQTPYKFEYWQYTEKGSVNGITGGCDIDVHFIENK